MCCLYKGVIGANWSRSARLRLVFDGRVPCAPGATILVEALGKLIACFLITSKFLETFLAVAFVGVTEPQEAGVLRVADICVLDSVLRGTFYLR
jgi:hypothetical protein